MFGHHNLISCCIGALGIIFFVISLQEGFYLYQLKRFGWTVVSAMAIVFGFHGHLISLWHNRLWFCYSLMCVVFHNFVEHLVSKYLPWKSILLQLNPEATR